MTTRIYVIAMPGSYRLFESRGIFIGSQEQLNDAFGDGDPMEVARGIAALVDGEVLLYDVPDDDAEGFCARYGTGDEPVTLGTEPSVHAQLDAALDLLARRDMTCAGCCGPSAKPEEYHGYLDEVRREVIEAARTPPEKIG